MKAAVRSIAYQIAIQVGFDFQAAATFSLSRHSLQLDFCHYHCHLTMLKRRAARGAHSCVSEKLLLRNSIEQGPSDSPPHTSTFVTIPRAPAVANWQIGTLAPWQLSHTPYPLLFLRERKGVHCFYGQSDTNRLSSFVFRLSLVSQSFSTRGARTLFGARSRVHATLHATSRVF